jgi:hypothetical protein
MRNLTMSESRLDREPEHPRTYMALPGRVEDHTASFHRCLADLLELAGADTGPDNGTRTWSSAARRVIRQALKEREHLPEEFFGPLIRAGVCDPNPSSDRQFIEPAVTAFGRRRVKTALIGVLRTGTDAEKAGAARAWYWTGVRMSIVGRDSSGAYMYTPESLAELEAVADLRAQWQQIALREFVANEHIDVRRCIIPGLTLNPANYPADFRELVAEAVRIARAHPDEYIRHRVEIQL